MNLIIFFFTLVIISVTSCADTVTTKSKSKFLNIPKDVILMISDYLFYPQKELGGLNKELRMVLNERPFNAILADRLGISELKSFKGSDGLLFLIKLSLVKDPLHILKAVVSSMTDRPIFGSNISQIIRYVDRSHRELVFNPVVVDPKQNELAKVLLGAYWGIKDYDQVIEYMIMNPTVINISFNQLQIAPGKVLIGKILNISESLFKILEIVFKSTESSDFSFVLYQHFLKLLDVPIAKRNFIILSIIANVPEHYYVEAIFSETIVFRIAFFNQIFAQAEIFESPEETKRIYTTLAGIVNRIPEQEFVRLYTLMNSVRFGDLLVSFEQCEVESHSMRLGNDRVFQIVLAAAMTKQHQIVLGYYNLALNSASFDFMGLVSNHLNGIYVILSLLECLNEKDGRALLNDRSVFDSFLNFYDFSDFKVDATNLKYCFGMRYRTKPLIAGLNLPTNFQYEFDCNSWEEDRLFFSSLTRFYMFSTSNHDESSLLAIFKGLVDFDGTSMVLRSCKALMGITASVEVMRIISESEELLGVVRTYGFEFNFDILANYAVLFRISAINLIGIMGNVNIPDIVAVLETANQFKNLEEFSSKNISQIFLEDILAVIPLNTTNDNFYFMYRSALLYWWNSEHRDSLLQLRENHSMLLKKLALELEIEDARFLLQI